MTPVLTLTVFRDNWHHDIGDPGLCLFTAALKAAPPEVQIAGRVLEIGCAECNWLTWAHQADSSLELHGIDWRACEGRPGTIYRGDVCSPGVFARPGTADSDTNPLIAHHQYFDTIVSLSAIEHIGLGHYENDPEDPEGDIVTVRNAYQWLKPGGWLYADVPYRPDKPFHVMGTEYRCYDDEALKARLLRPFWPPAGEVVWMGYAHASRPSRLIQKPTQRAVGGRGFHYAAMWLRKSG